MTDRPDDISSTVAAQETPKTTLATATDSERDRGEQIVLDEFG